METGEQNLRLTQVGPGTPAGAWLRAYWHPIAISDRWTGIKTLWKCEEPVTFRHRTGTVASWGEALGTFTGQPTSIRILGEDLVLFRDGQGRLGLIGERCPHRNASMAYGRVRPDGLECFYHGWRFDTEGRCLAQPAEPPGSTFREKVRITAYPVRELGGLIWAYLGPGEPPILPKWDVLQREDGVRAVENFGLWPVNYLQILENSPDTVHTGILHGGGPEGERSDIWHEIPEVSWEENEYGIIERQVRTGYLRVNNFLLPTANRLGQPWPGGRFKWPRFSCLWRTPVDDTHTLLFSVTFTPMVDGRLPDLPDGLTYDITEQLTRHRLQDYQAICSQGTITDRTQEHLGASDAGVILLRRLISEGIAAVARGEDPKGVWRDAAHDRILDLTGIVVDTLLQADFVS